MLKRRLCNFNVLGKMKRDFDQEKEEIMKKNDFEIDSIYKIPELKNEQNEKDI